MQAQRAEGTKDLIGRDMRAWQKMQEVAAEVFGPFGFEPIETPAIEQLDISCTNAAVYLQLDLATAFPDQLCGLADAFR